MEDDYPICIMEAENDIIWSNEYLYRKETYFNNPETSFIKFTEEDYQGGLFDGIPF